MKKAFAIFTAYYRRLEGAVGKFISSIGKGQHSTSNIQRSTFNEQSATSVPADVTPAATQDNTLLAPRLSGERNEVRGVEGTQHPTTNIEHPTSNQDGAVRAANSISATGATSPTFENQPQPGSAAVPAASLETRERDARAPRQGNARDESLSDLRSPNSELPNFITRQDLKRELDSLRRLMESRK